MDQTVYKKPLIYTISHIGFGFLSAWYIWVLYPMIAYQFLQLILNKRFFLLQGTIKDGNSVMHTGVKLVEVFIGYAIGRGVRFNLGK